MKYLQANYLAVKRKKTHSFDAEDCPPIGGHAGDREMAMKRKSEESVRELIAQRICNLRTDRGLSQAEVAERLGLRPTALCHFERGIRVPSFENLRKIADFYSVSVDYLLGRAEEPKAGGPAVEALFRSIDGIDPDDLKALAVMAQSLSERNRRQRKKAGGNGDDKV